MVISILIIFLTLVILAVVHEFGHFIVAKKFGTRVEEFGIGYPPRIFAKKIGDVVYSLNLLPFGAFVKVKGEEGEMDIEEADNMSSKTIGQRALIILGGVISFWIFGIILLSVIFALGAPIGVSDDTLADNAKVQIVAVEKNSPAEIAGIKVGDIIYQIKSFNSELNNIDKVKEVQDFININLGQEIIVVAKRGSETVDMNLVPRLIAPQGQGATGIGLTRIIVKKYSLIGSILEGFKTCLDLTSQILVGLFNAVKGIFYHQPTGVELIGPVGIGLLMSQAINSGFIYYLQFVAVISIHLAIMNLLPIPAVDGGRLLFLTIEKIKKSPINPKIEQKINASFFILIIIIMFFVTAKESIDILKSIIL
ncbi:MAG: site-2 protease family protein [Patescibacteria group bacterium]|nr:site-2 protease family protein [Patescibacteria group bacterium]MBU1876863.1 site-2 protease family protein [Patescibacteria group bacterium]